MTSPIMCAVIAGVAIAAVLVFIFREQPQPAYSYEHRQSRKSPQPSSSRQRRRRQPDYDDVCSICLESFVRHNYYILNCQHAFHLECIQELKKLYGIHALCPLCRCKIR